MYLWVVGRPRAAERAPGARPCIVVARRCSRAGGEGYVRFALVPTLDDCERAAAILAGLL